MATPSVSTIQQQMQADTQRIMADADAFLTALVAVSQTDFRLTSPETFPAIATPEIQFPVFSAVAPLITLSNEGPPLPPDPTAFSSIENVAVPELTAVAPVLSIPAAPSSTLPTAPGGAPEFVQPDVPSAPTVTLPAVPTFAALALPEPPSIDLPTFAGTLPVDDLLVPSNTFEYAEPIYESILRDPLKAKLLADLAGGYGIEIADETPMLQRARDREGEIMEGRKDEVRRSWAARGFPLPPGMVQVHEDRAEQEYQNKVSSINRDIYIKRADQFVENRKFTLEQVKEVEQIEMAFHNSIQERVLNVARTSVEMSLAIFDALVKRYGSRLEAYKAEASAFADRIRGELAKAEIYRTQIEAAGLSVQMQRNLVEVYKAQLEGIQVSVNIYRTQVEAAGIRAQIERQKLEAFRAQVDAYTAGVQAKVAEFGMFRGAVDAQRARQDIYTSEVQAFATRVQAAKTRSDMSVSRLQAEEAQARVKLANYQAQVESFKANVQRYIDAGRLQVDIYRANVEKTRSETDGHRANAELAQQAILATTQQNTDLSRVRIEDARARLLAQVENIRFRSETAKFGAEKFFAQILATLDALKGLTVQSVEE